MKTYYPSYYDKFSCISGACPDSCCKAWEIIIDEDTLSEYEKLTGELGAKIRKHLITDEDGDCCFSLINGKCPFLNERGLCDIHIALGEKMTSRICQDHPRFIEEYDGFTEISLSLSCPEAARIILLQNTEKDLYPTPVYQGEDDVLKILIDSRERIFGCKKPFFELIDNFIRISCRAEMDINLFYIDEGYFPSVHGIKKYIKRLLSECEILCSEWKLYLEKSLECDVDDAEFSEFIKINEKQIVNVFYYYVYRYYLKSVSDLDVYSRALFILYSVLASALISIASSLSFGEVARLYSKEIEHSTENFDILFETIGEY